VTYQFARLIVAPLKATKRFHCRTRSNSHSNHSNSCSNSVLWHRVTTCSRSSSSTSTRDQSRRRRPPVLGKSTALNTIAAANKVKRRKAVYCIDNVDVACTADDIKRLSVHNLLRLFRVLKLSLSVAVMMLLAILLLIVEPSGFVFTMTIVNVCLMHLSGLILCWFMSGSLNLSRVLSI